MARALPGPGGERGPAAATKLGRAVTGQTRTTVPAGRPPWAPVLAAAQASALEAVATTIERGVLVVAPGKGPVVLNHAEAHRAQSLTAADREARPWAAATIQTRVRMATRSVTG